MKCKAFTNAIKKWTTMSNKAILILCLCSAYMISCGGNEETTDDHSHEHEDVEHEDHEHDHDDHGHDHDDHGHDHDEHGHDHDHDQETFTVEEDSL